MGSMALQLKPFTVPDPIETYGRAMSLRALMDERRYRALREQQAQQKIADEERDRQESEAFQRGYAGLPEGATLKQIVSLPGGTRYGIPVFTQQRQAEEAALKAKTAGFTQQRTELELKGEQIKQARGQMQQYIRDLEYIDALPPEQQTAAYDALKAEYVQRGEPVDPNAPLPSDVERAALKKRFFDADTLLGEQAKALDIQLKEGQVTNIPLVTREQVAKTEKAEKELAGTAPPTGTLREFKDVYYPGWLQQKGITTPTARDEMNAYTDFRELLRARIGGVPGVDVPYPPAVQQQRLEGRGVVGDLTPRQLTAAQGLAKAFDTTPIVKQFNEVATKQKTMKAILDQPTLGGPGDLAFVYEFMKALDPTSVVRETEYANAAKSGNIFAGAWAKYNGYLKPEGGFLPPQVKASFMKLINDKLGISKQQVQGLYKDYGRRIEKITGQPGGTEYMTDYAALLEEQKPEQKEPSTTQPKPTHRYNPATGKVEAITR